MEAELGLHRRAGRAHGLGEGGGQELGHELGVAAEAADVAALLGAPGVGGVGLGDGGEILALGEAGLDGVGLRLVGDEYVAGAGLLELVLVGGVVGPLVGGLRCAGERLGQHRHLGRPPHEGVLVRLAEGAEEVLAQSILFMSVEAADSPLDHVGLSRG